MINYHKGKKDTIIAEILPEVDTIRSAEDLLDIMAEARYNDSGALIIYKSSLDSEFFNLRSGIAGEILQKFSNYRMKLAIVGEFNDITSRSLGDFIRESNRTGTINFVGSLEEAVTRLEK